jgi:uncharacterized membrane protein
MKTIEEARLRTLERRTETLAARLEALETRAGMDHKVRYLMPPPSPPVLRAEPAVEPVSPQPPAVRPPRASLEDLLGGRILAWTGGVAVVLGVAFLLAVAVSSGWIGPGARTLLAGTFAIALTGMGVWLHERRRRTDAALALVAAGIAAMFLTVAVGGPVYHVLPVVAALGLALAAGTLATVWAIRWEARGIGALGIVGALLAPVLAGAPTGGEALALLWVSALAGAAVVVWQRWNWLAVAVFVVALPQWAVWLDGGRSAGWVLLVLTAFGVVNAGAAVGFELRVPATRLRVSSALLLTFNAVVLALAGYAALQNEGADALAHIWLAGLAATHLAVGLATVSTSMSRDVRLLAMALGVILADVAIGLVVHGPLLGLAWATAGAGCALLAGRAIRSGERHDETLLGLGLGGHLLLSVAQALSQAPPEALAGGGGAALGGAVAIAGVACAAFVAGRFVDDVQRTWRMALDATGLAGLAYLTAFTLDGPALAVALAVEAAVLAKIAARDRDDVATWGCGAFLAAALGHALLIDAPADALVAGLDDVGAAALALGAAAAAALFGAHLMRGRWRAVLVATGVTTLLYLVSTALVTPFQPGDSAPLQSVVDLGVRQLGQALLSALWATIGVVALVIGLRRDVRELRLAALGLLLVTVGKVFLYDLAALTSMYRVASFIGLGLLLLLAAGVWQRMRPRPLPDLRVAPRGVR